MVREHELGAQRPQSWRIDKARTSGGFGGDSGRFGRLTHHTHVATVEPEKSRFETIVLDITHRCNMACANCYLPNREIPDVSFKHIADFLSRLPNRTNIRLAGAEPTLRRDLPEIIDLVRKSGHRAVLLTNGLRLARASYVRELWSAGLRHVYVSLNGADEDDWYERIDGLRCASKKLTAIDNVLDNRMLLNTGTILTRNVNEGAVRRVLDLVSARAPRHALLRFKNVGALGRYDCEAAAENITMAEMERLVADAIGCRPEAFSNYARVKGFYEPNTRLFPIDLESKPGRDVWVKLTDWSADDTGAIDVGSRRRGRMTQDLKVAPFFEHVRQNEFGY